MTVTLTTNYKEVLSAETVDNIEEWCVEGEFDLEDALVFIDEKGESDFNSFYEDYIEQGEKVGYAQVEAFIGEFGISEVASCEDSYVGRYSSEEEFAEEYVTEVLGESVSPAICVDWEATFEHNLSHEFAVVETAYRNCRAIFVFRNDY